jgi:septum formation protein
MKKQNAGFILASASPQRRRLLTQMGIEADVRPVDLEEDHELGDDAADLVRILALDKLRARLEYPIEGEDGLLAHRPESLILAADTIVALDEHRLGKPRDRDQARKFLEKLSRQDPRSSHRPGSLSAVRRKSRHKGHGRGRRTGFFPAG